MGAPFLFVFCWTARVVIHSFIHGCLKLLPPPGCVTGVFAIRRFDLVTRGCFHTGPWLAHPGGVGMCLVSSAHCVTWRGSLVEGRTAMLVFAHLVG
jgi:hypothetical protein